MKQLNMERCVTSHVVDLHVTLICKYVLVLLWCHQDTCSMQWIGMVYTSEQTNSLTSARLRCARLFHYTLSQQPRITSQPWDYVTMEMLCQCWLVSWLWRKRKLCPVKEAELRVRPYQHILSLSWSIILFIFNLLRLNGGWFTDLHRNM